MANAEEQRRLDELMNDVNFPMPGPEELDLDFDFDFDASKSYRSGKEPSLPVRESIVDQQYGAVAALATQGAVVRPVSDVSPQPFQQDWQMLQQNWQSGDPEMQLNLQSLVAEPAYKTMRTQPWEESLQATHANLFQQGFELERQDLPQLPQQASSSYDLQESDIQQQELRGHPVQESVASGSRPDSVDSGELRGVDLDAQARAERTKAKNKRAQKKFRQKQKERHEELERSAAELSERLKATTAELDALQNQKRVLEIALSRNIDPQDTAASTSQEPEEPVFIPAQGFERFSSKSGILLEVLFDPPRKLTHEQATRLSLKDHARIWKEQCRQASELLRSGAVDLESPSGKKLRALMNERHGILAWTSVNNPVIMHKLMTSKLVDPPVPDQEPPEPSFWQRILDAMGLTEDQQKFLLEARREYLREVSRLLEARQGLQATLKGLDTGFKSALGDKARTHILWANAVEALQENVDAFHICHSVFMVKVYNHNKGFSVVQEASLMVQSFPHAPDVFALLKELAVSTGQYNVVLSPEEGPSQQGRTDLGLSASGNSQEPYLSLMDKLESAMTAVNENFVEKLS